MGFAELKALVAVANQTVEEGQAVIGIAKDRLDDALNATSNVVTEIRNGLLGAQEKFEEAHQQYARISDNESVQAAAASAQQGGTELVEAMQTLDNILKDFQAALKLTEETAEKANQSGALAIEHGTTYTSRF